MMVTKKILLVNMKEGGDNDNSGDVWTDDTVIIKGEK